jgi:hypothetical protein
MRVSQKGVLNSPFSLREKVRACPGPDPGMRGRRKPLNRENFILTIPLTPALSLRERVNKGFRDNLLISESSQINNLERAVYD